jgi:Glycosyl transferase family 2
VLRLSVPVLSAIVISRDNGERILSPVRAVTQQECPAGFEVIVVTSGAGRAAELVRREFPGVKLVELPHGALPGEARNAGLRVALGAYVSFPGSHVELPQGSLAARMGAHRLGYPMVTGSVLNGTRTWAGWASYFLDHATALPGRPSGELSGPPMHCSYARELLIQMGGFREDLRVGEDTVANRRLTRDGHVAYRAQDVELTHHNPCRRTLTLLRHHFTRGRGFGRILLEDRRNEVASRRSLTRSLAGYLPRRLWSTTASVGRWGRGLRLTYARAFPLVVAGALAAWAGTCYEILRPATSESGLPLVLSSAETASAAETQR